mmetsp:Transcript_27969/g.49333  ORF Transcript_27969/g.49333 Transcript_27969/m.49333 type:complete len:155 (+) Transcript_27969:241-705(+)
MVHYQYKRKNLNGMASFYAEFLDSCTMNAGAWLSAAFLGLAVGYNHVAYMEFLYADVLSDVRYSERQMNLMFFFEFDLFDLVFDLFDLLFAKERKSVFHGVHHDELNKNISIFGLIPDDWVFYTYLPSYEAEKRAVSGTWGDKNGLKQNALRGG